MKQKILVYYFLILSIVLTLFLPVLNLSFLYKNNKLNEQHFSKQQLFSTDNLQAVINYVGYKAFNFSLNEPQVIVGKDNFFFLGNSYASVIDKTKGTLPYKHTDIDTWTTKLYKLQKWYEKQGIEFILVIAPNKHTVYSDKLPDGIVYKDEGTITDAIVNDALKKNIHMFNLKTVLKEKKEGRELYFHTDTHWNNYGALVGYIDTIKYLNMTYSKDYKLAEYTMKEANSSGGGDLTNLLRINQFLSNNHETEYHFKFKQKNKICYGKISKKNTLNRCTPGIKNSFNQYMINKDASNKEKLLYLCDSFGLENSQFYEETFKVVWRFHLTYAHGSMLTSFIQEHKPDIVIYQVVERDLGNNSILDDMPKEGEAKK